MARQKTPTANVGKLVENSDARSIEVDVVETKELPITEEKNTSKELRLISTRNVPLYKIATKQRNMVVGTIVAGHSYPYKGKTHNTEGIFYNMGKGFVFAEDCVKIQ